MSRLTIEFEGFPDNCSPSNITSVQLSIELDMHFKTRYPESGAIRPANAITQYLYKGTQLAAGVPPVCKVGTLHFPNYDRYYRVLKESLKVDIVCNMKTARAIPKQKPNCEYTEAGRETIKLLNLKEGVLNAKIAKSITDTIFFAYQFQSTTRWTGPIEELAMSVAVDVVMVVEVVDVEVDVSVRVAQPEEMAGQQWWSSLGTSSKAGLTSNKTSFFTRCVCNLILRFHCKISLQRWI